MDNYVSPVVFDNDELVEGVFATGSGGGECWTLTYYEAQRETQNPSDKFVNYRVDCTHLKPDVYHISEGLTMFFTIANTSKIKYYEVDGVICNYGEETDIFKSKDDGFRVTSGEGFVIVNRWYHANAYTSGDKVNYNFKIKDEDGKSTITNVTWFCNKTENVQGTAAEHGDL